MQAFMAFFATEGVNPADNLAAIGGASGRGRHVLCDLARNRPVNPYHVSRTNTSMNDQEINRTPATLEAILSETNALGFNMIAERKVGALLAVLAASKPRGRLLELGTGTGHGTAWLLSGMDSNSSLDSVDNDPNVVAVARRQLGSDVRVTFHIADGAEFIERAAKGYFDFVYADAWPGKFTHLEEALALLRPGGIYLIDDLLFQPNWPEGHAPKVLDLIEDLECRSEFASVTLTWASGLMVVVRKAVG